MNAEILMLLFRSDNCRLSNLDNNFVYIPKKGFTNFVQMYVTEALFI